MKTKTKKAFAEIKNEKLRSELLTLKYFANQKLILKRLKLLVACTKRLNRGVKKQF